MSWRGKQHGQQKRKNGPGDRYILRVIWAGQHLGRENWIECSDKGGDGVAPPSRSQTCHTSKLWKRSCLVLPHRGQTFIPLSTCFWRCRAWLYIVERGRCGHSLGVSDIEGIGLLGSGGWILGMGYSAAGFVGIGTRFTISFLDFVALTDLV